MKNISKSLNRKMNKSKSLKKILDEKFNNNKLNNSQT
jgi:hypothetical protein